MNWLASEPQVETTGKANARSWLNVGISLSNPEPEDVVIFWRESPSSFKGHVGIFMGYSKDHTRIYTLRANQSNQVSISAYAANSLLGLRRLRPTKKLVLTTKVLKIGASDKDVETLQDALKLCEFGPGTSDGIFGPKTEVHSNFFNQQLPALLSTGS